MARQPMDWSTVEEGVRELPAKAGRLQKEVALFAAALPAATSDMGTVEERSSALVKRIDNLNRLLGAALRRLSRTYRKLKWQVRWRRTRKRVRRPFPWG